MTVEVNDSIFWFALDQMRFSLFLLPFFPILYTAMSDREFPDFTFSDTFGVSFSHLLFLSVLSVLFCQVWRRGRISRPLASRRLLSPRWRSLRTRGGSSASSTVCFSPSSSRAATS